MLHLKGRRMNDWTMGPLKDDEIIPEQLIPRRDISLTTLHKKIFICVVPAGLNS